MHLECTGRLIVAILISAAVCGCKRQPAPTIVVDPALAMLVPADTVFIGGIHVQQLQPTPIYQRYFREAKLSLVEQFARNTGISVQKDPWEVVACSDSKTTWVMLRGKFAEMGLEPRISREGAQRL